MDNYRINLKNDRKIDLKKIRKHSYDKWETRIAVPKDAEITMLSIQLKRRKMGLRSVNRSIEWYTALRLYDFVLDYMENESFPLEADMFCIIRYMLEKRLIE